MKKAELFRLLKFRQEYTRAEVLSKLSNNIFPSVLELKEEFDILKKEQQVSKEVYKNISNNVLNLECTHEVRITYNSLFFTNSICTLCGKSITGDNCSNGTIYNDVNRNRYYASFKGSYNDEDYGFVQGVEENTVHNYIVDVLKKYNDMDEVDLVQELKNLELKECSIHENPFKKEYYILIVVGSNKQYIAPDYYITSTRKDMSIEIAHYFSGIAKANVEIIDSPENLKSAKFKEYFPYQNSNIKVVSYSTYEDILKEINSLSNFCPFDLIIDVSNINNYDIQNNQIVQTKINLCLKSLFPNSYIIGITEIENLSNKEFLNKIKQEILEFNMLVSYKDNDKVYSLECEENELKEYDKVSNLCEEVKKLVLKR